MLFEVAERVMVNADGKFLKILPKSLCSKQHNCIAIMLLDSLALIKTNYLSEPPRLMNKLHPWDQQMAQL